MRYGDRLNLSFKVTGPLDKMKIAPMMLFTFVENSFKHGSSNDPENPFIKINLEVNEKELSFKIENSKPVTQTKNSEDNTGGIGLANVKKRLEIIYKGKYELKCNDDDCCYNVSLRIRK